MSSIRRKAVSTSSAGPSNNKPIAGCAGHVSQPDTLLRPGQFARIEVVADTVYGALLIPQTAVVQTQNVYSVYVLDKDNRARQRIVTLGGTYGDRRIVTSGVNADERIVTSGFHKLREGAVVEPDPTADSTVKH